MKITEKTWVEYITRLSELNETAGQKMADFIEKHGTGDTDALIAYAQALVQKYGEGSAELACQMYDAMAKASGANVPPAEPAEPADYGETARMVNATMQSPPQLQGGVSRLVKRAGADTTLKNAIRFNGNTTVAGYDPEEYLAQYNAHGGDINAMRRAQYAENRIQINAQKRAAYAERKLREGGATDVLGEYLRTATPGRGSITYDEGYNHTRHAAEIKTAQWLHDTLGGDIVLLQETGGLFEKTPDFLWRNKGWELKSTTTEKSADSALRSALKQIQDNPGGVILNYNDNDIELDAVLDTVKRRLIRQEQCNADILIVHRNELKAALRYKK